MYSVKMRHDIKILILKLKTLKFDDVEVNKKEFDDSKQPIGIH